MTTIVRRRWNCRMSSNLLGVAALGIAIFAGCASEEPALPPVDTTVARPHVGAGQAAETGDGERRIRRIRERAGPSAGAVGRRTVPVRGQHAGQSARDLPRHRPPACTPLASVPVGLEPVAVAARRDERGLGGQPPLRQRQHRRRRAAGRGRTSCARCSSATSRATSCSPGPDRTRAFITTAHRGQNTARDPQLHHARRRPRRRLGVRRRPPRRVARRHAAHRAHAVRRHAARARRLARRADASTRRRSTPATGRPSIHERHRDAERRACRRRPRNAQRRAAAADRR